MVRKYKIFPIVKERWGWHDARVWLGCTCFIGGLKVLTSTVLINGVAALWWQHALVCLLFSATYMSGIFACYFLLSLAAYTIVTAGANRNAKGYRQMYSEYVAGEYL